MKVLEIGQATPAGSCGVWVHPSLAKVELFPVVGQAVGIGVGGGEWIGALEEFIPVADLVAVEIGGVWVVGREVGGAQAEKELTFRGREVPGQPGIGPGVDQRQILPGRQIHGTLEEISAARLAPPGEVAATRRAAEGQAGACVRIGGRLRRGGGESHEPKKQCEQRAQEGKAFHLPVG